MELSAVNISFSFRLKRTYKEIIPKRLEKRELLAPLWQSVLLVF